MRAKRKRFGRRALLSDVGMLEPWHPDLPKVTSPMKALRRVMDLWKDRKFDSLALYVQPSWCLVQAGMVKAGSTGGLWLHDVIEAKLQSFLGQYSFDMYSVCKVRKGPLPNQRRMMVMLSGIKFQTARRGQIAGDVDLFVIVNMTYELGGWYFYPASALRLIRTPSWTVIKPK